MRAFTSQENLCDFEQVIEGIEPIELDLSCCDVLIKKPVANTGRESIINIPNQIISE